MKNLVDLADMCPTMAVGSIFVASSYKVLNEGWAQ